VNIARHKLFLPAELFVKHGQNVESIFHGEDAKALRPAATEAIGRARTYLRNARALWSAAPRSAFPAFAYLTLVDPYLARLEKVQAQFVAAAPEMAPALMLGKLLLASVARRF
jgi:phytoene/squalene synthetase